MQRKQQQIILQQEERLRQQERDFRGGERAVPDSNRSHIQGYIEVAGQKADVILANPNGITVNGGGFINTNRAMVTTGKPNVDGAGQLRSIDVQQGDVRIEGAGINASNITGFDILSRATEINAEIYANDLTITTGVNSYDPSTGKATAQTPAPGSAPAVTVDSTALGGMYAGRITLTSTEKGVGVNLQGLVQSQQDLSITADGNLTVKNANSGANLTLNAGQGTVTVGNMAVAEGNMQVRGKALSGDKATLAASKSLSIKTDDSVTLTNESLVSAKETASIESKNVSLSGKSTLQGNNVTLNADLASLADSSILAGNDISLTAGSLIGTGSSIRANRNVGVNAGTLSLSGSPVASMENLDLASLPGSLYAGSTLAVTGNSFAFNGGFYGAGSTLDIKGQSVEAKNKAMLYAWDQVALEAVDIRLTDATVKSSDAASISGGNLTLAGGSITASGLLGLRMTGDVSLDGSGGLFGYSGLSAVARNLTNKGIIFSGWDLGLYIEDTLTNTGGADILAQGNMLFAGTDGRTRMATLNNEASTMESLGGDILIRADLLRNTGGGVSVRRVITSGSTVIEGNSSPPVATVRHFRDAWPREECMPQYIIRTVLSHDELSGSANGATLAAAGNIVIDAGQVRNETSSISSGGDISITADTFVNTGAELFSYKEVHTTEHTLYNTGRGVIPQVTGTMHTILLPITTRSPHGSF